MTTLQDPLLFGAIILMALFLLPLTSVWVRGECMPSRLCLRLVLRLLISRKAPLLLALLLISAMCVLNPMSFDSPEGLTILVCDSITLSLPTWFLIKDRPLCVVRHLVPLDRLLRLCVLVTVWTMVGCLTFPSLCSLLLSRLKLVWATGTPLTCFLGLRRWALKCF